MNPPTAEPHILFPYDFFHFWAAGKVTLDGGNPYNTSLVYEEMVRAGWPLSEGFHGFLHPPWTMWIFVPLGSLSFGVAVTVWTIFSLLVAGACFILAKNWIAERCEKSKGLPLIPLAFTFATFPPLMSTLWLGQTNILILLGILLFATLASRRKDLRSGAALSLVLIKPHLFIAFFCALLIFLAKNKQPRILVGLLLGFFAQSVLSLLLAPSVLANFLESAEKMASGTVTLPGASLAQTLHLLIPQLWIFPVVSAVGIGAACWLAYREKESWLQHLVFISLPLSLLTAPYIWSHSFLPLLLPYLALISDRLRTNETSTVRAHSLFSLLGICEAAKPLLFAPLMMILPPAILAFTLRNKSSLKRGCIAPKEI